MRPIITVFVICLLRTVTLAQTNNLPSSGNVGIGTANLQNLLNVGDRFGYQANPGWWDAFIFNGWWDNSSSVWRTNTTGPIGLMFWDAYNGGFHYYFGDAQQQGAPAYPAFRFVIKSNGSLGIGTQNPEAGVDISREAGDFLRFSYGNTGNYWMGIQSYLVEAGNIGYKYRTTNDGVTIDAMVITGDGRMGIGTTNPAHKLAVNGTIKAKEIIVETTGWSDYVFADDYTLAPLTEVEAHIKEHKHLPGIPSASQVAEQGVSVGEMQAKLLAKIEELTLHQIAQEKRAREQETRLTNQNTRIEALETENARLKTQLR
jgi:hypothetical protein